MTYLCIVYPIPGSISSQIVGTLVIFFSYASVYYSLSFFVFSTFWTTKYLLACGIFITFIFFYLIAYVNYFYIIPRLGGTTDYATGSIWMFFSNFIVLYLIIGYASLSHYLNVRNREKLRTQSKKERLLISKELNILKNSFNKSYTFSFLDYCHHEALESSGNAIPAISLFSKMLKYSLTIKPNEEIPIIEEIRYIEDFINLQKIVSTNVYAIFKYEVEANVKVLPRIFITFVENAFKHGIINEINNPIEIFLKVKSSTVYFQIQNIKNRQNKFESTGVGMENVQNILKLFYPKKHMLHISSSDTIYTCNLHLTVGKF